MVCDVHFITAVAVKRDSRLYFGRKRIAFKSRSVPIPLILMGSRPVGWWKRLLFLVLTLPAGYRKHQSFSLEMPPSGWEKSLPRISNLPSNNEFAHRRIAHATSGLTNGGNIPAWISAWKTDSMVLVAAWALSFNTIMYSASKRYFLLAKLDDKLLLHMDTL